MATALIAIAVVNEQQDYDDEQQPSAIRFTTEKITQTHIRIFLLSWNARGFTTCFHFILCCGMPVVKEI